MNVTRRSFVRSAAAAGLGLALGNTPLGAQAREPLRPLYPDRPAFPPQLADTFADLSRHFAFEYYPWYATSPWQHWNAAGRNPPIEIASNYLPALGVYDSASTKVLEQHARWIADAGVGAINVSWWGRDSDVDRLVPSLMDVMAAHDIHVTFHLEPYNDRHAYSYADDIRYLISRYGDGRRWDCFLLLENASGEAGPVFKSFATILPPTMIDCHGLTVPVNGYTPDDVWRRQTDSVRQTFRSEFEHITLLADSLDVDRTVRGGFDGIAIYDNFVRPDSWREHATNCTTRHLLFSFNINAGFDGVIERHVDPGSCYTPLPFEPGGQAYDWTRAADRAAAEAATRSRISQSFRTTIAVQTARPYTNQRRGFFLVYINSFNEWHEGDQFEPMKDRADLTPAELAIGYHNAVDGAYRLEFLKDLLGDIGV